MERWTESEHVSLAGLAKKGRQSVGDNTCNNRMVSMNSLAIPSIGNRKKRELMADVPSSAAGIDAVIASTPRQVAGSGTRFESSRPRDGRSQEKPCEQLLNRLLAGEDENLKRLFDIVEGAGFKIMFCDHAGAPVAQYGVRSAPGYAKGGLTPRTLHRVREYIEQHIGDAIGLEVLADIAGLSRCYFARAFKRSTGVSPHYFLMQYRLGRARELLAETNMSIVQIALAIGFSDQSHFSRRFRQFAGLTPLSFRQSHR